MRILIDTNVVIHREDNRILPETLQTLLRLLSDLSAQILIHPESIKEINNDVDEVRKKIKLSKVNTYPQLEFPPNPKEDTAFLNIIGTPTKSNDGVDNALLYAVYKNAVEFLITEDKGIHSKAIKLNMKDRVLSISEALELFEKSSYVEDLSHPIALKKAYFYNLDVKDAFFDSLKKEYPDFEDWFKRKSKEGRACFVHYRRDGIGALLSYIIQDEAIESYPPLPKKKRLKLSPFKVTRRGCRLGELFIKLAVEYAIKNNVMEIYLTHFTESGKDYLVDLIAEYGFNCVGYQITNDRKEDIFLKEVIPDEKKLKGLLATEISKTFWPSFYDGMSVNKFIVPILPEYHSRLFPEHRERRQLTLPEFSGEFIVEGNAIKKAYLCHSPIKKVSPGDILIFYRSNDLRAVTSVGVVEKLHIGVRDISMIESLVRKRTVYSLEEIKKMVSKPTTVILFIWHFHLTAPLKLEKLKKWGILTNAPQSIISLSHEKYLKIKNMGGIDERFTVN